MIGPYQGNVAATRRSWAECNADTIVSYVRAFRESVTWLYDAANRTEAIDILSRNLPQMQQEIATAGYGELLHPAHGFFKACELDRAGLQCVLELRNRYAPSAKLLGAANPYFDESYSNRT